MARYNWSESQKFAIDSPRSVIVSAGAGAGKTTLMIERILCLIRRGVGIDKILAVTFASAQAEDMREKLAQRLSDALADSDTADRKRLRDAYYRLPGADICTLHKFCADTVRRYFYLADVGADFSIADETDTALRRAASVEDAIEKELQTGDPEFLFLAEALSAHRSHADLAAAVWKIIDMADTQPDPEFIKKAIRDAPENAERFLHSMCGRFADASADRLIGFSAEARASGVEWLADYALEYADFVRENYETGLSGAKRLSPPKASKTDPDQEEKREEFEAIRKQIKDSRKVFAQALDAPVTASRFTDVLMCLADETRIEYDARKKADGALDFCDLERKTLLILSDDDARERIKSGYEAVFVDEYQDINPIQQAILSAIDRDRTFYVGDVKQSVYGFRLCDPSIFSARYDEMNRDGRAVNLNENYRSARGILRFCDRVFSGLLTRDFGGADYAETARFVPSKPDTEEFPTELLLIDREDRPQQEPRAWRGVYRLSADDSSDDRDGAYREGCVIAAEIADCMRRIRVPCAGDGNGRPLEYGDVAVLVRAAAGTERLADALRDNGIPVSVKTDTDLFASASVRALVDFLRVIYNAKQDYPLVAVMKKFFCFSDNDLAQIRLRHRGTKREGEFYRAVEAYEEDGQDAPIRKKLSAMRRTLADLKTEASVLSPSEVIVSAIGKTDFFAKVLNGPDGMTEYRLIKYFIDAAKSTVYGADVLTFLDYLDSEPTLTVEIADGGADAVTLSSIHKAKGLEYEVVFAACLGRMFNRRDAYSKVYVSRGLGVTLRDYSEEERGVSENRLTETAALMKKYESQQEETRILYVALTRAKQKLYLIGRTDVKKPRLDNFLPAAFLKSSAIEWILSAVWCDLKAGSCGTPGGEYALETGEKYRVRVFPEKEDEARARIPAAGDADAGLIEQIAAFTEWRYPYVLHAAKTTATELSEAAYEPGQMRVTRRTERLAPDEDATEVGNAYHKVMQHADFFETDARRMLSDLAEAKILTEREVGLVDPDRIMRAIRALAPLTGGETEREIAFVARFDSETLYGTPGDNVIVQGVADLAARDGESWTLVDYKTTAADESTLKLKYARQLGIYRDALTRAGYPIGKTYIYSFALNRLIKTDP